MRFELSEMIRTSSTPAVVLDLLAGQLRKISNQIVSAQGTVTAVGIEASFGSINRTDRSVFYALQKENGVLCVADVDYHPSIAFWILFILLLFTYVFWLLPVMFYLSQKKTVRFAIEDVFRRVKNECEGGRTVGSTLPGGFCCRCGSSIALGSDFCSTCGSKTYAAGAR